MFTSDFLNNGSTLAGNSGNLAINSGDLLLLNAAGQLYSVDVSDYASVGNSGAQCIPVTVAGSTYFSNVTRKEVSINSIDASIFILAPTSGNLNVQKYSSSGLLLASASTAYGAVPGAGIIEQLSNGNFVALYGVAASTLTFSIYDQYLDLIAGPTNVTATLPSGGTYFDMIALSGGGFAISYGLSGGVYLAIYTNVGGVTSASTLVTGSPTANIAIRMAQLSNNNIAIAISSSTASKALGHAIFSVSGSSVLGYTVLDSATSTGVRYPEISALPSYYCIAVNDTTNDIAYVINNAGTIQGSPYSSAQGGIALSLFNDGSNFELITGSTKNFIFIPVSGTNYIASNVIYGGGQPSVSYDNKGYFVIGSSTDFTVYQISSTGIPLFVSQINILAGMLGGQVVAKLLGDFAVFLYESNSTQNGTAFCAQKYLNTAIVGISQTTLPAANPNTIIPYSMGPGGYPCNPILGSVGKSFDNSTSNIAGNKGTILGNSVALTGIA